MMTELAPQDKTGSYKRPTYGFTGELGSDEFPDVGNDDGNGNGNDNHGRYHVYVGNPCPC